MRSQILLPAAAAVLLFAAGCGGGQTAASPSPTPSATTTAPSSTQPAVPGQPAAVVEVVDGDTVDVVTAAGKELTIRVLGIDTPEVYGGAECWGAEASQFARDTLAGKTVGLVTDETQDDIDRYGQTLRYLILPDGSNYSVLAAEAGAAHSYVYDNPVSVHEAIVAAEQRAQEAQAGLWGPPCFGADQTAEPAPAPEPEPAPETAPEPEPAENCEPGYSPCVPPYPPDVNCDDVNGPITVTGSDPHGLDGDGNGVGCQS